MQLDHTIHGDTLIVHVAEDRIDASTAIQFKDGMQAAAAKANARIVLDLSQVSFLDSSGLGAVVAVMKFCAPEIKVELAGLTPIVAKVFRLTRMDEVFCIYETANDALGITSDT